MLSTNVAGAQGVTPVGGSSPNWGTPTSTGGEEPSDGESGEGGEESSTHCTCDPCTVFLALIGGGGPDSTGVHFENVSLPIPFVPEQLACLFSCLTIARPLPHPPHDPAPAPAVEDPGENLDLARFGFLDLWIEPHV